MPGLIKWTNRPLSQEGNRGSKPCLGAKYFNMVSVDELKPIPERKIDFGRYPAAASKSIVGVVGLVNDLLEVVKQQAAEIEQLKSDLQAREGDQNGEEQEQEKG